MPTGAYVAVTPMIAAMVKRKPRTVLDLGVGYGFYGAAVRNFLDLGARPFKTWLAGVEGHEPYRNPCWEVYDALRVGRIQDTDFLSLLPDHEEAWGCILMSDVVEHFDKGEGLAQLARAKEALAPGGVLLVATPGWFAPQGAAHGNQLEIHRSVILSADLEPLGFHMLRREGVQADGRNTVIASWSAP